MLRESRHLGRSKEATYMEYAKLHVDYFKGLKAAAQKELDTKLQPEVRRRTTYAKKIISLFRERKASQSDVDSAIRDLATVSLEYKMVDQEVKRNEKRIEYAEQLRDNESQKAGFQAFDGLMDVSHKAGKLKTSQMEGALQREATNFDRLNVVSDVKYRQQMTMSQTNSSSLDEMISQLTMQLMGPGSSDGMITTAAQHPVGTNILGDTQTSKEGDLHDIDIEVINEPSISRIAPASITTPGAPAKVGATKKSGVRSNIQMMPLS
jgi:hypothetical protein